MIVHAHDVFLPYDYPHAYGRWLWNEQYLLHCLLQHGDRYRVLLASHFLSRTQTQVMRQAISPAVDDDSRRFLGAALWLRVCPAPAAAESACPTHQGSS